jgi:hypothetical protein
MEKWKNNGGIRNSVEAFQEAVKKAEKKMRDWREANKVEIKIENSGKGWIELQEHKIKMHDKETALLTIEKMTMEAIDSVITEGEQLLEKLQEPLRVQRENIFRDKKKAKEILDGAVEYLIEVRGAAKNNLENGNNGSDEEFRNFIKGGDDFSKCKVIENFLKCLKN